MGNRIPEEIVEQVRHSVDIVDVISEYVQLKKQGRNYLGLCPFHGENTPSFSVSPEKQIFHCFGCGAGGNALSFVMQMEGASFVQAVEKLANKTGIHVQSYITDSGAVNESNHNSLMTEAHELLKKYYHHLLLNTQDGKHALEYLLNRGFTKELIIKFEIGYAAESRDTATKVLQKRGFKLPVMEEAGLVIRSDKDGSFYDRFRNRIMFPIANTQGKIIAFSGRTLGDGSPKYLNSPETPIFNKGRTLYNFHQARLHIRKEQRTVLFEGYADVIAAVHAGIGESIATMGTALTEEQARIIRRNVEEVIICYDGDKAGTEASSKAADMLIAAGCKVRIAMVPEGLDPDEYVRKLGPEKFKQEVIEQSVSLTNFKINFLRLGKNLQDESIKIQYIHDVLKEIAKLAKPIEREHYLQQISKDFSMPIEALKQELADIYRKNKGHHFQEKQRTATPKREVKIKPLSAFENAERHLLAHMLQDRDVARKVQEVLQSFFHIEKHSEIIVHLHAYYEEGNEPDVSKFLDWLPNDELRSKVTDIANILISPHLSDKEFQDYIRAIQNRSKELEIKEKEHEMKAAEHRKDYRLAAEILKGILEIRLSMKS
ncbi:DNA primase [Bacillus sp. 165]|uniref:DNA primase n=1 Tax=Bacillus sp. 165 TaxID=1529117 RepID=UPI001ADC7260|nr:DNA primase [Bacillus sp. 165]MBO9129608.1 DNA primase [Bacillus sp. 165]